MAKVPHPFTCDICSIQKQDSNRWWKGYVIKDENGKVIGILVVPWDTKEIFGKTLGTADSHLCGEGHAVRWTGNKVAGVH